MKSLAGLQIGPENSTPLGPKGAKKSARLNLSVKGGGVQHFWGAPENLLLAHASEKEEYKILEV